MLVAFAPERARRLAAARHYLPYTVPLVKQVAAASGERVCARGADVYVDSLLAARRFANDSRARPLPWWQGCRTLHRGEAFLLSANVARAFDGRYFGVSREDEIIGEAIFLWPRSQWVSRRPGRVFTLRISPTQFRNRSCSL